MPSDEDFLLDICVHPDDDAPRLIYADWLDEQGRPERAEFIRIGCRLALIGADDPQRPALEARSEELLQRHGEDWQPPKLAGITWGQWERGFITEATARHAKAFLEHLPTLFRAEPLQRLAFLQRLTPRTVATVVAVPLLARLRNLSLYGSPIGPKGAEAVARSPHLAGLTELSLGQCRLGAEGFVALAESPYLRRLRDLSLWDNRAGDEAVRVLAGSPVLSTVNVLNLRGNDLGPVAARALAASSFLGRLSDLWLSYNHLGDEGVRALADTDRLPQLKVLYLVENRITDAGAAALAAAPLSDRLTHLALGVNAISPAGARALAEAAWPNLRAISVVDYTGRLGAEGIAVLRQRFGTRANVFEPRSN
jgi:uncharacterized protein (TIGR02996 family)